MEKKTSKIKCSSLKKFEGSKPAEFFGEGYFLRAEGSNYARKDASGKLLFVPYEEQYYLPLNRKFAQDVVDTYRPKTVMVLGCARGYLVKAFRELGVDAVGIDISQWAIENSPEDIRENLYVGDVCDLSLWPDKTFDLIMATDIFEHIKVPDLYTALNEVVRVTKKVVLMNSPVHKDDLHPDDSEGGDKSHVSVYSVDFWKKQFLERSFEAATTRIYPTTDGDESATIVFRPKIEAPKTITQVSDDSKQFKIAILSNAPFVPSGYGVQVNALAYRLKKHYDVRCIANYGLEGRTLGLNDLMVYPKLPGDEFGGSTAQLINAYWKNDVLITLYDIWMGAFSSSGPIHPHWIPIVPVDHDPIQPGSVAHAQQAYRVVAMSQFGFDQLKKNSIDPVLIPHGVDTNVFKPSSNKKTDKTWLNMHSRPISQNFNVEIGENDFLIGINGANKDPQRKGNAPMLAALQIFLDDNPDAKKNTKMYIHSWPVGARNIQLDAQIMRLEPYVKMPFLYDLLCGVNDDGMTQMYGAFDVFANCSQSEGFGIPIIEACACGVPPIATDWTAMTELVKGHGYLIPKFAGDVQCPKCKKHFSYHGGAKYMTALSSLWAIPDEYKIAEAYEKAYNNPEKARKLGEKARAFSLNYDWDTKIFPLWLNFLEQVRLEIAAYGISDEKNRAYEEKVKQVLS